MSATNERQQLLAAARQQTIEPAVLAKIEKNLGYATLHLSSIEKQERFLIGTNLEKHECPWCDSLVSYFECIPADKATDYKIGYGCEDMKCPECKKRVVQAIPFIGTWFWTKHANDKNPNRRK